MADRWQDRPGIRHDEPLSRHSQYGIGGPADLYADAAATPDVAELLRAASADGVPVTVIGAGSNTLILDGGIRGLVIKPVEKRMRLLDDGLVELTGGYMLPRAALDLAREGRAGLEFGIGVPGTCGASVYGNAGAFGTEVKDVLVDCDVVTPAGELRTLAAEDCGFGYRDSRFKHDLAGHVVVAARFRCTPDDPAAVRRRTDAIQAQRKATQPYGIRSIGSMFKNPTGDHAGRLVEAAGLKGLRIGGAEISGKHANFVVNVEHASAADVLALAERARAAVREQFGVELEREIIVLGEPATVAVEESP
jgi:UDP-N-acetylmuramate dehydrogenase